MYAVLETTLSSDTEVTEDPTVKELKEKIVAAEVKYPVKLLILLVGNEEKDHNGELIM